VNVQDLFALGRRLRDTHRLDGVVLGVDDGSHPRVAADGSVTPGTVLPWGSITKVVNAAAVVATGCGLDAFVHRGATLRHLLSHSGGLQANSTEDLGDVEPLLPPGRVFGYSNVGVLLAADSVGATLGSVLGPMGVPEQYSDDVPSWAHRAGGLRGTMGDLLRVGGTLGSPEWSVLARPQVPAGSYAGAVGLGWFIDDLGGRVLLRHEGRTPEGVAAVAVFEGVTVGVLVPDGSAGSAAWMALRALLGAVCGVDPDDARPQPDGSVFDVTGTFTTGRRSFELIGDVLVLDGEHRLLGCGVDSAKVAEGPQSGTRVDVIRNAEGGVLCLRLDGRLAW
jgi:hypothetical protein